MTDQHIRIRHDRYELRGVAGGCKCRWAELACQPKYCSIYREIDTDFIVRSAWKRGSSLPAWLCPQHWRHVLGHTAQVGQIQSGHAKHQVGNADIHLFPQPRGDLPSWPKDGMLFDVEGRAVVSV
jgi:hypothetical protein